MDTISRRVMSQYHMHRVINIHLKRENLVSNECKFQHTSNAEKVKKEGLNTLNFLGLIK